MDLPSFQEELTKIGGRNLRGEPILKVVRGDREMKFACGQMIPKYFAHGRAKVDVDMKFRLRHALTGEVTECTRDEAKAVFESYTPESPRLVETSRTIRVMPQAREGYFIEQWIPPEKIQDTPESWERQRYQMFSPHGMLAERMTDMIGPFPFQGRYEIFLESQELNGELLTKARRAWHERNRWKQTKSDQLMVNDIFEEAKERAAASEAETADMLTSEFAPHVFQGTYLSGGKPNKVGLESDFWGER